MSKKRGLWKSKSLNQSPNSTDFSIVQFTGSAKTVLSGDPLYFKSSCLHELKMLSKMQDSVWPLYQLYCTASTWFFYQLFSIYHFSEAMSSLISRRVLLFEQCSQATIQETTWSSHITSMDSSTKVFQILSR